mgnify:CR=1 FL=1
MKKIKLIALALVACSLGLASCGEEEIGSQENGQQQQQQADEVVSVAVSSDSTTVTMNKTLQLTANVETKGNASKNVTWSASPESVATVSASGLVTPVSIGEVVITATSTVDSSKKGTITLNVVAQPKVLSVAISGAHEVKPGETLQLTANVEVEGSASREVTWISLNESVATVNESGLVTTLAAGTAAIKAVSKFDDSKFDQVNFAIKAPAVLSFADTMPTIVEPGVPVDFSQYVSVTGDSTYSIAPSAGYKTMVSINGKTVTFLAEGTVKLTFSAYGTSEEKTFTSIYALRYNMYTKFSGPISEYAIFDFDNNGQVFDYSIHSEDFVVLARFDYDQSGNPLDGGFLRFDDYECYSFVLEVSGEPGEEVEELVLGDKRDMMYFDNYNGVINIDWLSATYRYDEEYEYESLVLSDEAAWAFTDAAMGSYYGEWEYYTDATYTSTYTVTVTQVEFMYEEYEGGYDCFFYVYADVEGEEEELLWSISCLSTMEEDIGWPTVEAYLADPENKPVHDDYFTDLGIASYFFSNENKHGVAQVQYGWVSLNEGQPTGFIEEPADAKDTYFEGLNNGAERLLYSNDIIVHEYSTGPTYAKVQQLEGQVNIVYDVEITQGEPEIFPNTQVENVWDYEVLTLASLKDAESWPSQLFWDVTQYEGSYYVELNSVLQEGLLTAICEMTEGLIPLLNKLDQFYEDRGNSAWTFFGTQVVFIESTKTIQVISMLNWDENTAYLINFSLQLQLTDELELYVNGLLSEYLALLED